MWNTEKQEMEIPDFLNCVNGIIDRDNYPLMQYVGIEDANGKEIYEGDIVEDTRSDETLDVIEWGGYRFIMSEYDEADDIFYCPGEWKVVGNIYDNPDLVPKPL
jgi:uncharacterized phage protein (TIGR01671 family)